ncbi:helix-turn-helix domain-containing protein [Sphingomonas qomolangmaensis]|uniref:Helix-turn-helix domain-containing protein n=1 Tax=Sphingomonas qomolangmaensis TaxID=2918765 RepID=A0ABY5LDI2_9SPHN|nr:helix-turn-helix domain-containing protein [Sphingomonas qomolangmaensis]UUL84171.1 helix-turn-helix domain-containing protein [Sphingomonas qomolangmaensis]
MLDWSLSDLAEAAGVGRATAARFELGQSVQDETAQALRSAFESRRIRFIDSGKMAGGVYQTRAG